MFVEYFKVGGFEKFVVDGMDRYNVRLKSIFLIGGSLDGLHR